MPVPCAALRISAIILIALHFSAKAREAAVLTPAAHEDWFEQEASEPLQVGADELVFLPSAPVERTLRSVNTIHINPASLVDGWVQIKQCYRGLDAVAKTEIVYRYNKMRNLDIDSYHNIGDASVYGDSVQLSDVGNDATLCIRTEAQILRAGDDGRWLLRNGPFQRRYLDGFFPMHVSMEVIFPAQQLRMLDTQPRHQTGFAVTLTEGRVAIDSWFAGSLTIEIIFASLITAK